ncbi:alpha/beta fold hydrolase [Elusimicrobiota bacterium]
MKNNKVLKIFSFLTLKTTKLHLILSAIVLSLIIGITIARIPNKKNNLKVFVINGRRIYYTDEGKGKPILLIHGYACDHIVWQKQVPVLSKKYRVITLDLPFFGKSDPGYKPHNTASQAKDCLALLNHLDIHRTFLLGHSMGGTIARDIYFLEPERVKAIIGLDNSALMPALNQLSGLLNTHRPTALEYSSPISDPLVVEYEELKLTVRCPKPRFIPTPPEKWCKVPILVIWTTRGSYTSNDIPPGWITANSPAKHTNLVIVPNSGHWIMFEQTELLNRAVLNFLDELN